MSSLNRATLIGNVGADPEIKTMTNGNRVANLSLATSETWKDKTTGEKKERTEWHRVVVWQDGLIGVIEKYVHKGSKLMIEGQIQTRKYEHNGVEKYSTEIVLQGFIGSMLMLDGKASGGERSEPETGGGGGLTGFKDTYDLSDDIPFMRVSGHDDDA